MPHYVFRLGGEESTLKKLRSASNAYVEIFSEEYSDEVTWKIKATTLVFAMDIMTRTLRTIELCQSELTILGCERTGPERNFRK